ncbi:hypothetical protein RHSIM_Rhsim13G0019400 [Rhododendron simsii]|uniref:Uncharacterized protein n=1 Tax=Rhododendron simsii TaxID=118357 RepID=A0A834L823_RHOSS|nr:hypothetical protein RHSIM_Rhsim13G0019400 [Rhododendron simsii]
MLGKYSGIKLSKSLSPFLSSWNFITKRVDSIGLSLSPVLGLSCLKELSMENCNLSCLPNEVGNLISLETLDLGRNNLRTLPDSICNLTRLKKLYLSHCDVSHLPSEIGRLVTLEALILEGNSLVNLPDSICNLTRLKNLNLSLCGVSHLPSEIGRLISLQKLNLGGNNLLTLPDSICNLACLEVLSLPHCNVSHLPDGIGMLSSLKWFDIRSNNVSILPNSFSDLASLEILYLSNCGRLQSLPKLPASLCHVGASNCTLLLERIPTEFNGPLGLCLPLQEWSMQRINHVHLPGDEVPNWFPYQYTGSKLSLVVPPLVTRRIIGWALCIVFRTHKKPAQRSCMYIFSKKTEGLRNENKYKTEVTYQDEDRMKLMYFPSIVTGIHLFSGDELEIEISPDDQEKTVSWLTLKKCGIKLVYEDDVDITGTNGVEDSLIRGRYFWKVPPSVWIFSMLRRHNLSKFLNSKKRFVEGSSISCTVRVDVIRLFSEDFVSDFSITIVSQVNGKNLVTTKNDDDAIDRPLELLEGSGGRVEKWREALTEVANLSGWDLPKGAEVVEGLVLNFPKPSNVQVNAKAFKKMNRLWLLHLNCTLSHLPGNIGGLISLETLNLGGNKLVELPGSICDLTRLKALDLKECNVSYLPGDIGGLISLETLNLGGNDLLALPGSICHLTRLKSLDLKDCKVSYLPGNIGGLVSLETLNVQGNWLVELPGSICGLTRLKSLDLKDCNVSYLPGDIGGLISLETLNLGGNDLLALPGSICHLTRLKSLDLKDCKVSYLPNDIGGLVSLQTLNFQGNRLVELPGSICDLTRLKSLDLKDCNVSYLPGDIGGLMSLETLNLGGNRLVELPSSICDLTRLKSLDLKDCNVSELPDDIGRLVSLETLNGLSMVRKSFDIILPGNEVPYQNAGSHLTFVVPSLIIGKTSGWISCVVFMGHKEAGEWSLFDYFISYKSEDVETCTFHASLLPPVTCEDQNQMSLVNLPLCYLESGDEVEISMESRVGKGMVKNPWLTVKKCGLKVIYEADENII